MSDSDSEDRPDDDFYRWFVGGSPPETDGWPRHAFEQALLGCPTSAIRSIDETSYDKR